MCIRDRLGPIAESKGLQLAVTAPGRDLVILTDRRALSQILLNLANNAVKFTDTGDVRLALSQHRDDGGRLVIEISVADTGCGIRPEDQARLFQAFERLQSTGGKRHEGTGLGLHLSQKLASMLGGHIRFASEFGQGSTFTVSFPQAA